ncbi:MAG: DUF2089 family protein [bacterium]|nr:DUF2089 family protein [bacterium]
MSINFIPAWMKKLNDEDINFIKIFVLSSGSLKEVAKKYNVTYPTVRIRLNKLIEKIHIEDLEEQDSYVKLIKKMALNKDITFDSAKILIQEYRKTKKGE